MPFGGLLTGGILAGGSVAGSLIGGGEASSQEQQAMAARQAALQQYLKVNVPDPAQQQLILQKYQQTGQLDPAMEQAINAQSTAQGNIAVDPTTRAAQMSALSQLSNVAANQGQDAQEKNQIQQGINAVNSNEQGQTQAILQNAAARGVGGSGASLAAELEGAQAGANNASQNAMSAQSLASQRALSAMSQTGALAGQVHNQDYAQQLNQAEAQDSINQFNARNQTGTMAANTLAQNQAQAYNVQEGQNISNQNAGLSNYEQQYNQQLQQQQFNDQMQLASGQANAENGVAGQANYQGQNDANMWGGVSSGLATIGGQAFKSAFAPKNQNPNNPNGTDNGGEYSSSVSN